jgi:SOS-response transcriptional repressor LexA
MVSLRIREIREDTGLTQEAFGAKIGNKQSNIADWERGRSVPSLESLQKIVDFYGINLHWLLTGQGLKYLPSITEEATKLELKQKVYNFVRNELNLLENDDSKYPIGKDDIWYLPLQGEIAAGSPLPFNFDSDPTKYVPIAKSQRPNPNITVVFRVNGDSMEPKIEHSDIVVIKKEEDWWICDNKVIAVRTHEGLTLKKLVIDHVKNSLGLVPFNPKYNTMFTDEDCQLIGYLIFLIRQC